MIRSHKTPRVRLAIFFSGFLYGVSFPPSSCASAAWISLVPLFFLLSDSPNVFRAFRFFFVSALVAHLLIFRWVFPTFAAANVGLGVAIGSWFALSAIVALYIGLIGVVVASVPNSAWRPWLIGAAWVAAERLKGVLLTGFPWAELSHTQLHDLWLIQSAAVWGSSGISFLIVATNVALADLLIFFSSENRQARRIVTSVVVLVVVTLVHIGGALRLRISTEPVAHLRVAVLQGDINEYQKWDTAYETGIRSRYESLVLEAKAQNPQLIVWPESAVPGWIPNDVTYVRWLENVVRPTAVPHIVGAVTSSNGRDQNAAFLIGPDGQIQRMYAKQHLVPFGEYIPFGKIFSRWIPYLGQLGTFSAGTQPVIFSVGPVRIAPTVCYESIFSDLVRRSAVAGAQIIVNLTNDGWFLDSGAPGQHFAPNVFRAVENERPLIRAANTGISAVIDAYGRVLAQTKLLEPGVLMADVAVGKPEARTIYQRGGYFFPDGCLFVAMIFLFRRVFHRGARKRLA